jgi:hypothetical protein
MDVVSVLGLRWPPLMFGAVEKETHYQHHKQHLCGVLTVERLIQQIYAPELLRSAVPFLHGVVSELGTPTSSHDDNLGALFTSITIRLGAEAAHQTGLE